MVRKGSAPPSQPERPRLLKPRAAAAELIQRRIDEGEELLRFAGASGSPRDVEEKERIWNDYTRQLLKRLFTTEEISREFGSMRSTWDPNIGEYLRNLAREIRGMLVGLRSILRRLELFEEVPDATPVSVAPVVEDPDQAVTSPGRDVFVVHGRDEGAKQTVARFLEKLHLRPIVLHEQPNQGSTIIEKLQRHSQVSFAVVLLTPDDEGRQVGTSEWQSRARQNVILELGFFVGFLGRERVCAPKSPGVEVPSDLAGVVYIELDPKGAWNLALGRELKAARLDIDLNLVV
jgi:hypothetical protein